MSFQAVSPSCFCQLGCFTSASTTFLSILFNGKGAHHQTKSTRAIKSSKANYNRIVLSENLSRPKQFWNRIKKCYHTKNTASSTPKSFQINDKIVSDEKLITDGFCSYFTEIGKSLQRSIFTLGDKTWKYYNHSSIQGKVNPKNALFNFKLP